MSNPRSKIIYDAAMDVLHPGSRLNANKASHDPISFQLSYSIRDNVVTFKFDRPLFAAIPSGEGKTTLQSQNSSLFADWEQLLDSQQWAEFQRLLPDKKWDEINNIFSLIQIPTVNPNRIYLVHGFSHVPLHLKQNYLGAFLLDRGTNIRENVGNRKTLMKEPLIFFRPTFSARNEAIVERALLFLNDIQH
ncbi:23587_t:CDS:2 [Cetraspora pellucida]|uniref:23587_t:CDS:1 n=1 Tax=Cetraspora pellucida TaxID=1433469 RepID=A0A9N9ARP1_9GLOM|nr:23587_t:CDS:2 [Cetraspora pellucida]